MRRLTKIGGVAAGSVALLAGGGYALGADEGSGNQSSAQEPGKVERAVPRFSPQQAQEKRDQFYADLGEKLGKSKDEVKAAFRSLLEDKLSEEVKADRLTEDQKDAILQGFDAGLPGHGPGGPGGPGGHGAPGGQGGPGGGMAIPVPPPGR